MKPTDTNIAEFFHTTRATLRNWKTSKDKKLNHRYEALKKYFIEYYKD